MSDPLDPRDLRTVHLVPLTAYDDSGRINAKLQTEHIRRMDSAGMRVFLPAAGTSEFHSLSADEIVELVRITREASGEEALVFAPVGLQIGHAVDIATRAMEAGATGIMFMPFAHPYLSDAGAEDYYRAVIDRVKCPALIYKKAAVPTDDLLLELADDPHIVGVKYAVNSMHQFRKVVLADGGRIEWLCGSAERFAPYFMLAGAGGYTTGAGNVCPHLALAMHSAFAAGEYREGMRLQESICLIENYREREADSYNISMLKEAMRVLGQDFGPPRPPQRRLTDEEQKEIARILQPVLETEREMESELAEVGLSHGHQGI